MKTQVERWYLYENKDGQIVLLSRPFKTKAMAEKERHKYPVRRQREIGVGRS